MATKNIDIVINAKDHASKELSGVGGTLDGLKSKATTMAKAGSIALASLAAAAATAGVVMGVKFNSDVEQARAQLMAFTNDGAKTAQILEWVKKEAALTQFSFTEMARAAAALTPVSKQTGVSLEELVRQAEVLAALNPAEGLTGAVFSLREALGGDWVSITDRFNLPRVRINELKNQGIPAMKVISQALGEMGIDYGLVAAQGQTAAARFDQVKDKLTMLAGAAMAPIFERLSNGLDNLANGGDWESLTVKVEYLSRSALAYLKNSFDTVRTAMTDVWNVVAPVLMPAIQELSNTIMKELWPALKRLWDEVSPTLIPVLRELAVISGAVVVSALYALIKALNLVAHAVAWGSDVLRNIIHTFELVRHGAVNVFSQLPDQIRGAIGRVKDFIIAPFQGAYEFVRTLPRKMVDLFAGVGGMIRESIGNIDIPGPLGKIKDTIPGFAAGTLSAPGGLAVVGERGPELVSLPKGARVYPNSQTNDVLSGVTQYNTFNVFNEVDLEASVREIGWRLARA